MTTIERSAELSVCAQYRWWLRRQWEEGAGIVSFIMLNPSKADGITDDPTVRRCIRFAQRWGFKALEIRNLFPHRATKPRALLSANQPTGGHRGDKELLAAMSADRVVVAWGGWVPFKRDAQVLSMINAQYPHKQLYCLGTTKDGKPRHPLFCRADLELREFMI